MQNILFVCHGDICRSPMAQFIAQNLMNERDLNEQIRVNSLATHTDEIGSAPHPETLRVLHEHGLKSFAHKAVQVTASDYEKYDLILCMDNENIATLEKIFSGDPKKKIKFLTEFTPVNSGAKKHISQIADPYYTHDFETTFRDIFEACCGLIDLLSE